MVEAHDPRPRLGRIGRTPATPRSRNDADPERSDFRRGAAAAAELRASRELRAAPAAEFFLRRGLHDGLAATRTEFCASRESRFAVRTAGEHLRFRIKAFDLIDAADFFARLLGSGLR